MERQPNMKEANGDEMALQIGDNNYFQESNAAPEKSPVSGLMKAGIIALAAGTGLGVPAGIGLSMMGGDTTNTTITEPIKKTDKGLRLGKPDVTVQLQSPNS